MSNKRIIRSIVAVISLLAMLLSLVACNAKPIDNFKRIQQKSIDRIVSSIDDYYEKIESNSPQNATVNTKVNVQFGSSILSAIQLMADMDFDWINNIDFNISNTVNNGNVASYIELALNDKSLISADIAYDTAKSIFYFAIPILSEKYLAIDLEDTAGADIGALTDIVNTTDYSDILNLLPEKAQMKELILKYFGIVIDNITDVTEAEGFVSASNVTQECTVYKVVLTQRQVADIITDLLNAVSEDETVKSLIYKYVDYVNEIGSMADASDVALSADDIYNEFVTETKDAVADINEEVTLRGEKADGVLLEWETYVSSKSEIIGCNFLYTDDNGSYQLFMASAKSDKNIGQEIYIISNGGEIFALGGDLTNDSKMLSGTYDLSIEGETIVFIDLADIDVKKFEAGLLDGSISISPSKALLEELTNSLDESLSFVKSILSTASLKVDIEQNKKEQAKITFSIASTMEEYLSIAIDTEICDPEAITIPANTTDDAEEWSSSFNFNSLITALEESDLPDGIVFLIKILVLQATS